jgi:hypothetical protein
MTFNSGGGRWQQQLTVAYDGNNGHPQQLQGQQQNCAQASHVKEEEDHHSKIGLQVIFTFVLQVLLLLRGLSIEQNNGCTQQQRFVKVCQGRTREAKQQLTRTEQNNLEN